MSHFKTAKSYVSQSNQTKSKYKIAEFFNMTNTPEYKHIHTHTLTQSHTHKEKERENLTYTVCCVVFWSSQQRFFEGSHIPFSLEVFADMGVESKCC